MENREQVCSYALSRIFSFEPRLANAVVETFGDASSIFSLDRDSLFEALGPYNRYRDVIAGTSLDRAASELDAAMRGGCGYLYRLHPDYPEPLAMCDDAPVGFFVRSSDTFSNVFSRMCVAVVGTRNMTSYGRQWCTRTVNALADTVERPTIVSGLAFGVDITAHLAALDSGLPTVAVLGNGVDSVYPAAHYDYAGRIASLPGCAVITEYPPGASVVAVNFLCRNRIIAGLSRATVLVESRIKGGGMTTARQAASYGRDVYAVPGRNDDLMSQGCNLLIRQQTAVPVTDCDGFVESLGFKPSGHRKPGALRVNAAVGRMDGVQLEQTGRILLEIRSNRDITLEELGSRCGISYGDLVAAVTRLEADGLVNVDFLRRCSINE